MDEAQILLKKALQLPDIEKLQSKSEFFGKGAKFRNYSIPLGKLDNRFDGSYHVPVVQVIEKHLRKFAKEVTCVGDSRITQSDHSAWSFQKRSTYRKETGLYSLAANKFTNLDPKK